MKIISSQFIIKSHTIIYYQQLLTNQTQLKFASTFRCCYDFQVQVLTAALNNAQTAAEHAQQVKVDTFLVKI